MSMFEVWLLLVFAPKLTFIFIPVLIGSLASCIIAVAWGLTNWENVSDARKVSLYIERGIWTKDDEFKQETALKGVQESKKLFKVGLAALCVSALLVAAVPDKKEIAGIVLIPYISNNPEFKKLPENIVGVLNDLIKEYREELKPHNTLTNKEEL